MMKRAISLLFLVLVAALPAKAEVGDDRLHKEDWFTITFRDIADDIAQAKSQGKRLAIVIEQRGCIYCREMHEKLLSDPEVRDYIKANYMVVQYNMFGDEEVTDTDGEVRYDPEAKPGVANLLSILAAVTGEEPATLAGRYEQYGPLKADVAEALVEALRPLQERYAELSADPAQVDAIIAAGAAKAAELAEPVLQRALTNIGLR